MGNGLSAVPAARGTLSDVSMGWRGLITRRQAIWTWLHDSH